MDPLLLCLRDWLASPRLTDFLLHPRIHIKYGQVPQFSHRFSESIRTSRICCGFVRAAVIFILNILIIFLPAA
ncbi:MAG: hypothetical protein ACLR78_06310 [Roseburia sp.]